MWSSISTHQTPYTLNLNAICIDWELDMNEWKCEWLNEWMGSTVFLYDECDIWVFFLFQETTTTGMMNGMNDCVIEV